MTAPLTLCMTALLLTITGSYILAHLGEPGNTWLWKGLGLL